MAHATVQSLIRTAQQRGVVEGGQYLAESTVWRLLKREGLMERAEQAAVDRRRFAAAFGPMAGLEWLPSGVDTERFTPRKRDAGLRSELAPGGELLVGYVGRLAPEKRIERLTALGRMPVVSASFHGPRRDGDTHTKRPSFHGAAPGSSAARVVPVAT